jgi:hypothetical protein
MELHLQLAGVDCTVSCEDEAMGALVARLWSPFAQPRSSGGAVFRLRGTAMTWQLAGPGGSSVQDAPHAALTALATAINQHVLGHTATFACHAAVVTAAGGAVALIAASGTGKSTLTAALLQAGAGYVSDEALCVDRISGAVVGYPRPLCLLPWSRSALGVAPRWAEQEETHLDAAELGAAVPTEVPAVSDVVLLLPFCGGPASIEPVARQRAAAELLTRSFNHWRDPAGSFALAHGLVAESRTWQLRLGPPRESAAALLEQVGAAAPSA